MHFGSKIFSRLTLAAAAFIALAPTAIAADDWNTTVAKAKQEGIVVVHGGPGKAYNAVLVGAFNKAYPDIKVQFSGANGAIEVPKVLRERQAGIYGWDVWTSGPTTALGTLKESGFFQPLKPVIRPENMADDKWIGGFAVGWMDNDQNFYYAFDGTLQNPVLVNWDVVSKNDLQTLDDLLKPQFKGKIVWHDPRVSGTGNGTSQTLMHNLGEEKLIQLWKHDVTFTINGQQIAEWTVRGRYPIAIGLEPNNLNTFQSQGVGMNVQPLPDSYFKVQQMSVGFGAVGFVDKAPHPNAAIVYINWLLSKDGQQAWTTLPRGTRRADVTTGVPELMPKKGVEYFIGQAEKFTAERLHVQQIAKQAISGPAPSGGKSE
jgi:iron(III) transport system substrate-binding protein